jgi:hypothetical protein
MVIKTGASNGLSAEAFATPSEIETKLGVKVGEVDEECAGWHL